MGKNIRNFCIISHIDHGKSTLADRIMEICGAVSSNHQEQLLDSLELEREHGITIKLKAVRLRFRDFIFNLIDTPGHVDFSYEVSRSLASVEGAVLLVDATQGVQAQTLSNFNLAIGANLTIIPVVNKIDSPAAEIDQAVKELEELGFRTEEIVKISARTGENVAQLLEEIIERIPGPRAVDNRKSALIFDSSLDPYKGVVATVRSFCGSLKVGEEIVFLASKARGQILQIGYLSPGVTYENTLEEGQVGFLVTNIKDLSQVVVGDTITSPQDPAESLPGYKDARPVVFLSFFPSIAGDFPNLKDAFEKLRLNDSSLAFSPESSLSLGQGLRVGFLGLLHAQITQERLEREYNLDIIVTSPSVNFIVDGKTINRPSEFEPTSKNVQEPVARVTIFTPEKYYGAISNLVHEKRGEIVNFENIASLLKVEALIPLLELLIGFYDQLKSISSGYASLDFEVSGYQETKLVKLDILVNQEAVEALAQIVPAEKAETVGRKLVEKLKEAIPRQQIPVPIQAAIGGKIVARETVSAYRKDVTQKLYGGDVTRKMKLLEKQKKGKKRMKRFGNVDIPQEAFLAVLKI